MVKLPYLMDQWSPLVWAQHIINGYRKKVSRPYLKTDGGLLVEMNSTCTLLSIRRGTRDGSTKLFQPTPLYTVGLHNVQHAHALVMYVDMASHLSVVDLQWNMPDTNEIDRGNDSGVVWCSAASQCLRVAVTGRRGCWIVWGIYLAECPQSLLCDHLR